MVISFIHTSRKFSLKIKIKDIVQIRQIMNHSHETDDLDTANNIMNKLSPPLKQSVTLHNGLKMPLLGFGTYRLKKESVEDPVRYALSSGYRHIDTASVYRNEQFIGKIINQNNDETKSVSNTNVQSKDIFITTKLAPKDHGYEKASAAIDESIKNLGISPIDLFLVHWPGVSGKKPDDPETPSMRLETWRALEQALDEGKVRAIGVSNFTSRHLIHLLTNCRIKPHVNQIELHPLCPQTEMIELCKTHQIQVVAYSSLGVGELLDHPVVLKVSNRKERTPAQILIRWAIQKEICVIPKASSRKRIEENSKVFEFELSKDDMLELDGISREFPEAHHFCWNPESVLF